MPHGIFVEGRRPKSKKEVKEALKEGKHVSLEDTGIMGKDYDGPVAQMPEGKSFAFVGPDPYTRRSFYGTLIRVGNKITLA